MKLNCGLSHEERIDAKRIWHRWFAWRPVRVGSHDCRWLEYVERKGTFYSTLYDAYWIWEYRPL